MIKFFRKIRERLLAENKFSKYLIYAVGEIVLVVIGILIALSINNWNEERKTENNRQRLISSLIEDFEYTYNDIVDDELPYLNLLQENMDKFYQLSKSNKQTISVDSLRELITYFFSYNHFNPNLTTYNEAVSSGSLSLLKNKELMNLFTRFMQYLESLSKTEYQSNYSYYNGASWEFRKSIDPNLLSGSSKIDIPYEEYRAMVITPLAQNAFTNQRQLNNIMRGDLKVMSKTIEQILELLKKLKEE